VDEKGLRYLMNILFLQETDWIKRGPHQQHHLADMLSVRGHNILVIDHEFTWRKDGNKELFSRRKIFKNIFKVDNKAKVTLIRPGIIKIPLLDYISLTFTHANEIRRQIKEFSPDVIVGYGIINAYLAAREARKNNIPFIYYWIDVLHRLIPIKPFRPIGKILEIQAIKGADIVLVINEKLGDYAVSLGANRDATRVVRAGIDVLKYNLNVNGDLVRQQYQINKNDIVLFFMGWLYRFSGIKEVALKLAETSNNNLKLLVVGKGDAFDEIGKIRISHNLQDRIILTGQKPYDEIPNFIAAADFCLLPAYPLEPIMQDIVPIKLYEYMAMGKPVISTRLPGVLREFGDDNGVFYIDKPEDAIDKAIMLSSNANLGEIGVNARKFAEKNSWEKISNEFENILKEVIKEKEDERLRKKI
jgi:glycosyltransferase involved in cell wall biosynthesis